jgi:transposase
MRGAESGQDVLFSYVAIEARIPQDHPLRTMRRLVDPILAELSPRFEAIYAEAGRRSIPPEQLLRALLLQILFTIRSERQLMEQLDYNLLYRWFVGLNPDEPVWDHSTFSKNRDRLLAGHIAEAFLQGVLQAANARRLLSHEHFTVDGTLLEAWASHKSLRPINPKDKRTPPPDSDGDPKNPTVNWHGQKRSNKTHRSTTDPDARLARKTDGTTTKLCHLGSVLVDNRYSLVVATDVRAPDYHAERDAALELLTTLEPRARRRTLGADKGYDEASFVAGVRQCGVTPHIAPNVHRWRHRSAIDERTTRHAGYAVSQRKRKQIEESFGWTKVVGLLRKLRHRGRELVGWLFTFTNAAYNLVRMRTLIAQGVIAA